MGDVQPASSRTRDTASVGLLGWLRLLLLLRRLRQGLLLLLLLHGGQSGSVAGQRHVVCWMGQQPLL